MGLISEVIPLFFNQDTEPYIYLNITGNLQISSITTVPSDIIFDPIPIGVAVNKRIVISLNGFPGYVLSIF